MANSHRCRTGPSFRAAQDSGPHLAGSAWTWEDRWGPPGNAGSRTVPDETQGEHVPERPDPGPAREPLHALTLGQTRPPPDPQGPPTTPQTNSEDEGLEALAARCRTKAEAARWAAERQRRLRERDESPDDDAPTDPAVRRWADQLTDAFYWASAHGSSSAPAIASLDHAAGCFDALAEGLRLIPHTGQRQGGLEKALPLLAEAQSGVRCALRRLQAPDDLDQLAVYKLVRETAARHRIFLRRFLRADDLADPEAWPALLSRIEAQTADKGLSKWHARRLEDLRSRVRALGEGSNTEADWQPVIAAAEQAVSEGVPPSSREIRRLLLPHIDDLPESIAVPPGFRRVLAELDRYLATRPPPIAATPQASTAAVVGAARLLTGRTGVLIGGLRRPQAQEALRAALELEELVWIGTRPHQSIRGFESAIARPEVAVVLLAIRWSSHAFGEVKAFCERHGKPLVRLPGGYNPAQVAAQVLAQCGTRLGAQRGQPPPLEG